MSVRMWVLAVAAVFGLANSGWAQGPGGGRHCGGGGGGQSMHGCGGQGTLRSGGGGTLTGNPMAMQGQLQTLQAQQLMARQAQMQQLQGQMLAMQLGNASAVGRANFARMQAARTAQLKGGR